MSEAPEQFNRVHALMRFERIDLLEWLYEYFGFDGADGTYAFMLTRCKSSRDIGTMSIDDFEEFTDEHISELADFLIYKLKDIGE